MQGLAYVLETRGDWSALSMAKQLQYYQIGPRHTGLSSHNLDKLQFKLFRVELG